MGRIRTTKIKRTADALLGAYKGKFKQDFTANKKILEQLKIFNSIKFRNTVAGLITKIVKEKNDRKI